MPWRGAWFCLPDALFKSALAASLTLHVAAWMIATQRRRVAPLEMPVVIDVDISAPFRPRLPGDLRLPGAVRGSPAPSLRPKSGGSGPKTDATGTTAIVPATAPSVPEKPWVLPGPDTRTLEKPEISAPATPPGAVGASPGGTGPGGEGGRGGSGGGTGTGEAWVNRPPRLLNREEILASLKRYYPESERWAGREGRVEVILDLGTDGNVHGVQVSRSAGAAFDAAAEKVVRKMIFEPALAKSIPVPARLKQVVEFRLSD